MNQKFLQKLLIAAKTRKIELMGGSTDSLVIWRYFEEIIKSFTGFMHDFSIVNNHLNLVREHIDIKRELFFGFYSVTNCKDVDSLLVFFRKNDIEKDIALWNAFINYFRKETEAISYSDVVIFVKMMLVDEEIDNSFIEEVKILFVNRNHEAHSNIIKNGSFPRVIASIRLIESAVWRFSEKIITDF